MIMGTEFKVMSLNVAGLKSLPKRRRIAKFLRPEREGMVCLVETHLNKSKYLDYFFFGKIFHAAAPGCSGGVMIGISQSIPWALTSSILDKEGHFVILKGKSNVYYIYSLGLRPK